MRLAHLQATAYIARRIALIDAGSTGTRLSIFSFIDHRLDGVEQFRTNCAVTADRVATARCLTGLMNKSGLSPTTPLALYATAGVRSLPIAESQAAMSAAKQALANYNLKEAAVLSGNSEAFYTMKAFEYLEPHISNFLLIDMGGQSVQTILRAGRSIKLSSTPIGAKTSDCACTAQAPQNTHSATEEESLFSSPGIPGQATPDSTNTPPSECHSLDCIDSAIAQYSTRLPILFPRSIQSLDRNPHPFFHQEPHIPSQSLHALPPDNIFLLSFFYDVLRPKGADVTLRRLQQEFLWECVGTPAEGVSGGVGSSGVGGSEIHRILSGLGGAGRHSVFPTRSAGLLPTQFRAFASVNTFNSPTLIRTNDPGLTTSKYCRSAYLVIRVLERLNIPEDASLIVARYFNGINLEWALGKAMELNANMPIEGPEYAEHLAHQKDAPEVRDVNTLQ